MSDKLSDCPFCGGTNCTATSRGISKWYFIYCPDCLAEGPAENTPDQAITAWNRRASPAPAISESDQVVVPTRVVELLRIINRDGLLKRATELQEVYRLIDAARKGEKS